MTVFALITTVGFKRVSNSVSAKAVVSQTSTLVSETLGTQEVDCESSKVMVTSVLDKSLGKKVPVKVILSPPITFRRLFGATAVKVH